MPEIRPPSSKSQPEPLSTSSFKGAKNGKQKHPAACWRHDRQFRPDRLGENRETTFLLCHATLGRSRARDLHSPDAGRRVHHMGRCSRALHSTSLGSARRAPIGLDPLLPGEDHPVLYLLHSRGNKRVLAVGTRPSWS